MASLKSGILLKLIEDMKKSQENASGEDDNDDDQTKAGVLLQVRSIIPVLEEGDLWPNKGFLLKVSDSSHAMYVSLSEEHNDMILNDTLSLGQYINITKLENSRPVPLLRGITPIPGRRTCSGNPEDIVQPINLSKLLESSSSNNDSVVEKGVILEKKVVKKPFVSRKSTRGFSDSESTCKKHVNKREKSTAIITEDFDRFGRNVIRGWPNDRRGPSSADNDSDDAESMVSSASSSTRISKRRSWNESEILGAKQIFDSSAARHEIKPHIRSRSANVSPARSVRSYESSDENWSSVSRIRNNVTKRVASATKSSSCESQAPVVLIPKVINSLQVTSNSLVFDRKGAETGILWNSLPSSLSKLGKDVVRQRDVALTAAVDALQEACASERLLSSLSTLSSFPLSERDNNDLQPYVDRFFNLQGDLSRTRLILQSLTSISPIHSHEHNSNTIKETLNTALERKKKARSWIKSAIALDLSADPLISSNETSASTKKTSMSTLHINNRNPKGACIIKKSRSDMDFAHVLTRDKEEEHVWIRGCSLSASSDLAVALQEECRKLFLSYVDKYLDEVEQKCMFEELCDSDMAETMYKVKMVSECLDTIVPAKDSETEADYGKVRNKIYGILLKHVERTALAFERLKSSI